ncbi:MAG TPA: DUF5403 family protein [Pseudonocardia sp.]
MARVTIYKSCNSDVAHLTGVIAAVASAAGRGAARADAILSAHKPGVDSTVGPTFIEVTHGKTDSFVNLVDPGGAAAAIEFGRLKGGRGTTRGVGAITGAF